MKLLLCIVLVVTSTTFSQHPEDLVSADSLAILSIQDGSAIQTSLKAIDTEFTGTPINDLLSQFIKNPSAIDYSQAVILSIEPSVAAGLSPGGMFGAMPHLVVICKPKAESTLELNTFSGVNISTMHDGWFVAAGGTSWTPPESGKLSPIFSELPEAQVGLHLSFGKLWSQIGPVTQMAGGMMIGQLNKPGISGVIDPATRKQTAAISQAFRKVMQFCSQVETISASLSLVDGIVDTQFKIAQKKPQSESIDNTPMQKMASSMRNSALQYAMSEEFTQLLLSFNLESLGKEFDEYPVIAITEAMRDLGELQGNNVVMFGLEEKVGLTISSLVETTDQEAYLSQAKDVINNKETHFAKDFQMKLTPRSGSNTEWTVSMLGETKADLKMMHAVIPSDTVLAFRKVGDWIGFSFGAVKSNPFLGIPVETDLSRLITTHENISVDFAMAMDARKLVRGLIAIEKDAGLDTARNVPAEPSVKTEVVLGMNATAWILDFHSDIAGFAKLMAEID